ncbi:LIC_13387 family protein [Micromonospora mirobrigensis]|uniref:Uncharacterized protein n=1 Tax=Micromonospora mirobrigensis TaxID=262898 RepID=A0A1C4Z6U7_9ACTN|nr:hypothetical protein [Micromonospora mirobrigensis]SCF28636.1 hypothetical protein GA0070564_105130 [Micromonospora mirobrigensis]
MDSPHVDTQPLDRRLRRAVRFGAGCLVLVGAGHLAVTAAARRRAPSTREVAAHRAMRAVPVRLLGHGHDMAALHQGFSVTMALLAVGYGSLNLLVLRAAPQAYQRDRSLTALNTAVTGAGFAISLTAFPLPPVVIFGAGLVAQLRALALTPGRRG